MIVSAFYFDDVLLNSGTIPGFGLDPFFCMFVIHTNAIKLLAGNWTEIINLPFFFPKQHTLAFSDPLIVHSLVYSLLYQMNLPKDLCIRIMFFVFFLLNWFCCSLFLHSFKKNLFVSVLVGWLFAFSLFFQVQSAHYQNLIVFPIFLSILPFFKPTLARMNIFLLPFLGTLMLLFSNLYFFVYGLILFFSLGIFFLLYRKKRHLLGKSKYAYFGLLSSLIVAIPFIIFYSSIKVDYPEIIGVRNFEEKVSFSARPWDYFKVLYPPMIYFDLKKYFVSYEFERSNFSGLMGMLIFTGLTLPYFRIEKFKRCKPQVVSIFLFAIGVFLASGPLILTPLYKFVSKIVPGLSEIRAVGRAGLIINIAYVISIFIFLTRLKTKTSISFLLMFLVSVLLICERFTEDFPTRYIQYHLPLNKEARQLVEGNRISESDDDSILVITNTIEDFIRIPFYLSIETGIKAVNGYSGYNPIEWNNTQLFFEKNTQCKLIVEKNKFLLDNSTYILIEKQSPIFKLCLKDFKDFSQSDNSMNFALLLNRSRTKYVP